MIEILQEVTEWDTPTHNGVYHIGSDGKMVAYQTDQSSEVKEFSTPKMFNKSRRKFIKVGEYPEAEDVNVTVVTGSNGNTYIIRDGKCSCSGFKYRGMCKHINSL